MTLEDLGFNNLFDENRIKLKLNRSEIGRVIIEHKERYIICTEKGETKAEITGNLRFNSENRSDFPAVGDWVAIKVCDDDLAIIYSILPRKSMITRLAIGQFAEKQVIAANIDYAFIVLAVDRDFSLNRIDRYLTLCHSGKVEPVIILSKIDLINKSELDKLVEDVTSRVNSINVIPISSETKSGYENLNSFILKGKTYCVLGSSGVGKSTMINNIAGKEIMKTSPISLFTEKGKHTTNHRELIILESGGILIDNPGMREVGIADDSNGLEVTFDLIIQISSECKFSDCTHTHEKECAVLKAVEQGIIDEAYYKNYLKMEREKAYYQMSLAEKRKKDREFGKHVKEVMKYKKKNKY